MGLKFNPFTGALDQVAVVNQGDFNDIFIDADGNVGIGTTSPAAKLHVGAISVLTGNLSPTAAIVSNTNATGNAETTLGIYQGASSVSSAVGLVAGVTGGAAPYFAIKTRPTVGGNSLERLRIDSNGIFTLGDGTLNAVSLNPGTTGSPLVRDSSGRVGIGTSSPSRTLHVVGAALIADASSTSTLALTKTAGFGSALQLQNTSSDSNDLIRVLDSSNNIISQIQPATGGINFATGNVGFATGNVGIGTTLAGNSANKLSVRSDNANSIVDALLLNNGSVDNAAGTGVRINFSGVSETNSDIRYAYIESATASVNNDHYIAFGTNSASTTPLERARIDSSGRLLVGTSTSPSSGQGQYARMVCQGTTNNNSGAGYLSLQRGEAASAITSGTNLGLINFGDAAGNSYAWIKADSDAAGGTGDYPGRLVFSTTADGASSPTPRVAVFNDGKFAAFAQNSVLISASAAAAGTSEFLFRGSYNRTDLYSGGTASFYVYTNGDVKNTNNSYDAISDSKLKENIVDAGSQWSDIKSLQVRNYNFKEETGHQTHTQIGLIAQELELTSPGLVTSSPDLDDEGNDLGTVTKGVKYSVLYMKAVKALQEAMERIETLEAKVSALEAN